MPDKAIDLIDESASRLKIEIDSMPVEIDTVRRRIVQLEIEQAAMEKETAEAAVERREAIAAELAKMDRNIPLTRVRIFEEYMKGALARPRFNAMLLTIFAGVALLLTAIGIYGVMAYSVAQRTSEIGVRMALGAGQSSIFRLVVGQAMTLVGWSIGLGLAGAFAATRLMNSLLFGVTSWDPLTFAALAGIIALVAFLAAWLPARRAARVDPVVALRAE
jgi:putative ABC transport system permease protein